MDLTTLRDRVRSRVGNPTTTEVPDADLTQYINEAYREIATKFRHHMTRKLCDFNTSVGVANYGLPTDILVLREVYIITDAEESRLLTKGEEEIAELTTISTNAKPTHYHRFREFIQLAPVPDAVYSVRLHYKFNITDLSADGDTPVLSDPWHIGIVYLARWIFWDELGDIEKGQYAWNVYRGWLRTQPSEVSEETEQIDSGVRLPTAFADRKPSRSSVEFDKSA